MDELDTPDEADSFEYTGHDPTANKDSGQESESIPEYTAEEEREDNRLWRTVVIGEQEQRIDMKVIEPYRRVISHGGDSGNLLCSLAGQMTLKRMRRRVAGWCVCVYVLVATVTSFLLSPFHLLASKLVLHPFHACLCHSGKVCALASEGLRRLLGGCSCTPPSTYTLNSPHLS